MTGFFVILVLLMVLVFAVGSWSSGAWGGRGRRIVVERRPRQVVTEEIVEVELDDADIPPRSRRVVRRRSL